MRAPHRLLVACRPSVGWWIALAAAGTVVAGAATAESASTTRAPGSSGSAGGSVAASGSRAAAASRSTVAAVATRTAVTTPPQRPNLLLIVAEDLGARIGAFGDPIANTPTLDALAAQGVRYPNTFTTAGVCAPSRAALITGLYQIAIGAQHMRASSRPEGRYVVVPPPQVKAFPELLRRAGYHTSVNTKLDYQFSGPLNGSGPFTIWDVEGSDTGWRERDTGQPFFAMLNLLETHESGVFTPLGSWPHSGMHLAMQLMRAWTLESPGADSFPALASIPLPPYYPDTPTVRRDLARHYANIHAMDASVARALRALDADGLADSTIVFWTTDHGDGLPRAKRELFDSGIRVPMIVHWPAGLAPPDLRPGGVDERLVSFVDLAPTLLALAGADAPVHLQGRNFLTPDSPESPARRHVFAARDRIDEVPDRQRAVRDARFKYIRSWHPELPGAHPLAFRENIAMMRELRALDAAGELNRAQAHWFEPVGEESLFDTANDPDELHDLSAQPAYRAPLERLRVELISWLERVGDWSSAPESEMVERMWPGGRQPTTDTPNLSMSRSAEMGDAHAKGGGVDEAGTAAGPGLGGHTALVTIECATEGASIGVRVGDGRWRVYVQPFAVPIGSTVHAKAVRYGYAESEEVALRVPTH